MNARLRSIIALLLVLSFGLALPTVHGQQLMIHSDVAPAAAEQPTPPCHATPAPDTTSSDSDGCDQCADGDCQCQLITLSPPATVPQPGSARPQPDITHAPQPEAPNLGQLRQPWRPPSSNV